MRVKTSELIKPALDWAVAKCEELPLKLDPMGFRSEAPEAVQSGWWVWPGPCAMIIGYTPVSPNDCRGYSPSTDWAQGCPIIDRERISVCWEGTLWVGSRYNETEGRYWAQTSGPTPLVAAMRCYVASKLGDEVDVPEELSRNGVVRTTSPSLIEQTEMNSEDQKLFEGHTRTWDEPRPAGMYLTLHHGRDDPQQEMDDFGFDGPIIGPFKWCHITYGTQFNFGWVDGGETGPCAAVTVVKDDMLKFDGKYYGDWEFQLLEELT